MAKHKTEGTRTRYFDRNGNIVSRTRRFAGICKQLAGKRGEITEAIRSRALRVEAEIQREGEAKYAAKEARAEAKAKKGGATLLSAALSEAKGGRKGRKGGHKGGGARLAKIYFHESGQGFTATDNAGKRLGSISRNADGTWSPTPNPEGGAVGKLRVAKARIARALHMSMR